MKKLIKILSVILAITLLFVGCAGAGIITSTTEKPTTEIVTEVITEATTAEQTTEVVVPQEVIKIAKDTKEEVKKGEDLDTKEEIKSSLKEENSIEAELEPDANVESENLSYDGTNTGKGLKLLGECQGLTYYSQADSRWANVRYTSCGSSSQTIRSSGCGPTSAAMVISSSKGAILPTATAKLSVSNGFRTASNGTAWSFWPFIADYFDFKEYHCVTSFDTMIKYLKQDNNKDGVADYFVVASCGPGLFTSGGHYIALMGDKDNTITVYDPYYYYGKFNTASRRAANVKVNGNIAYVTEANAKKYGKFKMFWIYSNDYIKEIAPTVPFIRYVSTKGKVNIYSGTTKDKKVVGKLINGKKVKILKTKNGYGQIKKGQWIKLKVLVKKADLVTYKTKVGKTYTIYKKSNLYSKGNLTGTEYTYKAGAKAKVIKHYNTNVDKVYIAKTGRYAYIKVSNLE